MMQHYLKTKQLNPDALLFYRLGDFYELFFEDAKTAARELELTLTGRDCGLEERAPMAGVPWHSADTYISRLVKKGYKVAICEQMEDPSLAKGLVKRELIRIVTPGTLTDSAQLAEKQASYLYSVYVEKNKVFFAGCDVSTGEFFVKPASGRNALVAVLSGTRPKEIITNDKKSIERLCDIFTSELGDEFFALPKAKNALLAHFKKQGTEISGLEKGSQKAAGALIAYLDYTQKSALPHVARLEIRAFEDEMLLDASTIKNLELLEGINGQEKSLLWVLDKTVTSMGARALRHMIEAPLAKKADIEDRLDLVEAFYNDFSLLSELREELKQVYDLERLLSRLSYKSFNARDCLSLKRSLIVTPKIKALLQGLNIKGAEALLSSMDEHRDLALLLENAISEDSPLQISDGGVIKTGFSKELDEYRLTSTEGKRWLLELEEKERKNSDIKNLRVQYNRVFGYFFEVSKGQLSKVPEHFIRRQTLVNSERYTSVELKELEDKLTSADSRMLNLEIMLFNDIRDKILLRLESLLMLAEALKNLDALLALSSVAQELNFVRPKINEDGELLIHEGRHPVIEKSLKEDSFVPNDTELNCSDRRMIIITGPNMAGKSTYMRQTALITLMAHMGSFVPALEANIPLVDRVFTRIGASDDLASGQSTFMVEMSELSEILKNATDKSLIILDEIGRGTSTLDGLAIAWSCVEYIVNKEKCGAKALFATHYHELSELEKELEGIKNYRISVKELGEDIIFLHKIVPGGADKSFGVYVAKLAGLPRELIGRAREIQARLEVGQFNQLGIANGILEKGRENSQLSLLDSGKGELVEEIAEIDVLSMNPMEALNYLFVLREKARKL